MPLFRRSNRGLTLTDEGLALAPTLFEAFGAIDRLFEQFEAGGVREVLTVSAVGTFVVGALLERLPAFRAAHPLVDLRILTNNNKVDVVAEGLDYAIRFGDGAWHGCEAELICEAPMSPLCAPQLAQQLREPADLLRLPLLRSYRPQDWLAWFKVGGTGRGEPARPAVRFLADHGPGGDPRRRRRARPIRPVSARTRRRPACATIPDRRRCRRLLADVAEVPHPLYGDAGVPPLAEERVSERGALSANGLASASSAARNASGIATEAMWPPPGRLTKRLAGASMASRYSAARLVGVWISSEP